MSGDTDGAPTSTSAPAGRRPGSPRARSTATAPSDAVFAAPRATARGSSSRPTSSWSAATPTAPLTSTSAPGGRRPRSRRARSTATAPSTPLRRRLERRLEGLLRDRRAAGQRRHRRLLRTSTSAPGGRRPRSPRARSTATAPSTPSFEGASSDGSKVFFYTDEQLVSGDTDSVLDVYERSGRDDDPGLRRGRSTATAPSTPTSDGASSDGSRVFFNTDEQLVSGDTDSPIDIYERSGGTTTQVSQGQINGNGAFDASSRGASSDGSKVFFTPPSSWSAATPTARYDVYERSGGTTTQVSQGQINGNGAFDASLRSASSDGSKVFFDTAEQLVSGDTDSSQTSTSAPGGPRPRSPRARSTATAPSTSASSAPRATARRSSSSTAEQLVSGDTDSSLDVYERSGGTTTQVSQGQINGIRRPPLPSSRRLQRRLEGLLHHQRAAGQRRHRTATSDVYERSGGTTTLVSVDTIAAQHDDHRRPERWDQRPDPDLQLLLLGARLDLPVQARRRRLCGLQLAEDRRAPRGRLPHLLRPRHGLRPATSTRPRPSRTFTVRTAEVKSRARPWWSPRRPGPRTTS